MHGRSSLTLEGAKLHLALVDAPGVSGSLRVIGGGHTWDFWIPESRRRSGGWDRVRLERARRRPKQGRDRGRADTARSE